MSSIILTIAVIVVGFLICLYFWFFNKAVPIPSLSKEEKSFVSCYYNKNLRYEVFFSLRIPVFFSLYCFSILLSLLISWAILVFIILSAVYLFSEGTVLYKTRKQAFDPTVLYHKRRLDSDDNIFQSKIFSECESLSDDYGYYSLVDPKRFSLSSMYTVSLNIFSCFASLFSLSLIYFVSKTLLQGGFLS